MSLKYKAKIIPSDIDPAGFYSKCNAGDINDCWEWTYNIGNKGYGMVVFRQVKYLAHRVSYQIYHGTLDPSKVIDHMCNNRKCINPLHLREVDQKTNCLQNNPGFAYVNSMKTECHRGHPFSEENTRIAPTGQRVCRKCHIINIRIYKERKKKKALSATS